MSPAYCLSPTSASHPDELFALASWSRRPSPGASLTRTTDILLQHLRDRGEVIEEVVIDDDGWQANTGKVVVGGPALNLVGAYGLLHLLPHGRGAFTSVPQPAQFSRPNTNAPAFRQHDVVVRDYYRRYSQGTKFFFKARGQRREPFAVGSPRKKRCL